MNLIIRQAKIIDPKSNFHNQVVDLKIIDGKFAEISSNISIIDNLKEIQFDNLHVSQGWFDASVCFGEPGFEDRETIENGLTVAAKSGFTGVCLQPNSFPVLDNQSQINFVKSKSLGFATDLFPIGALTKNSDGKDMAELFDMKNAGAIAFGDYKKSIENANLMKIALQYAQDFDGLIIAFSQDDDLKGNGIVNEGIVATSLGLKGIPNLAEELQIARNLKLLEYSGGKLHIPTISAANSVELIREAKAKGLQVTCSVSVHNLVLTDEKLRNFDTRYKLLPPLRTKNDVQALIAGILDNTIDCITSDHNPIDIEHKKMEFDMAKNGTIGLESAFGSLLTILPLEKVIKKLTFGRTIFGLEHITINIGQVANISLFETNENSVFTKDNIQSKSKNSAFLGEKMKGKVYGIYNNSQLIIES